MQELINIEQKVVDYDTLIDLLSQKKAAVEGGLPTEDIDRKIEVYKLEIEIREKVKYRDQLMPLLEQEQAKFNQAMEEVKANMGPLLDSLKEPAKESMSKEDQAQYYGIRKINHEGSSSPVQKLQAYRFLLSLMQKYAPVSNDSNEDE